MVNWREEVSERCEPDDVNEIIEDWLSAGDIEDDDEPYVPVDKSFPTTIMVVNVPKVNEEKSEKLKKIVGSLLTKLLKETSAKDAEYDLYMPINEELSPPMSEGYCILTFQRKEDAAIAKERLHNQVLDKGHTFKVYMMDEFEKTVRYDGVPRDNVRVNIEEVTELRDWIKDEFSREMFVCRYDQGGVDIYWYDHFTSKPELEYDGERERKMGKVWCDSKVQWSPLGSYFATFHRPGIALWGGHKFTKRARLMHDEVKAIDFSPNEEFVLTWNGKHAAEKHKEAVKIWKICTGDCVAVFPTPSFAPRGGEFPHFLWSPDGRYLARVGGKAETSIYIYDAYNNFEVLKEDNKPYTFNFPDGMQGFDWSPKQNILSVWIPERTDKPARLVLMAVPSRIELSGKNLFSCRDATMHWQPEGKYLCVSATRVSKSGKSGHTHLEIFRVMEKNVPVETIDIKDTVKSFHWEPKGNRFCMLTTDEQGHNLKAVFYAITIGETKQVASFDLHVGIGFVCWAPAGQYLVLGAKQNGGGELIFAQIDDKNKFDVLHKDEHFLLTDVYWDPSSRYFISAVTQTQTVGGPRYQTESGYKVWSFQGRLLSVGTKEKLYQLLWRPHPPSLLSDKELTDVKKNLKSYSKRYDQTDEVSREATKQEQQKERAQQNEKFQKVLDKLKAFKDSKFEKTGWKAAWEKLEALSKWEILTEDVEEILEEKEEVIKD